MKNKLKIILPNKKLFPSFLRMKKELAKDKNKTHGQAYLLQQPSNFPQYNKKISNERRGISLAKGKVPATTFWGVINGKVVGNLNLRHRLNKRLLEYGGNIGYGVHPKERNKGYATEMLRLGLKKAWGMGMKKVLITCDEKNIPSRKVIEKNKGIFASKFRNAEGVKLRFWIYK